MVDDKEQTSEDGSLVTQEILWHCGEAKERQRLMKRHVWVLGRESLVREQLLQTPTRHTTLVSDGINPNHTGLRDYSNNNN